jgi:exopolysaccharide production protein ExoZ
VSTPAVRGLVPGESIGYAVEPREDSRTVRFSNIQFLRLIAAAGVVLFHLGTYSAALVGVDPFFFRFPWTAGLPVPLFFAVSGFVLAGALQTASPGRFLFARFLRLYPGYWLALLGAAALMRLRLFTEFDRWLVYFVNWVELSLWSAGPNQCPYFLGVEWSLIYEVFLSASLAALFAAGGRRALPVLYGLWVGAIAVKMILRPGLAFDQLPYWLTIAFSVYNVPFLFGVLVFHLKDYGRAWRWPILALVLVLLVVVPLQPLSPERHWFGLGILAAGILWLAVQFRQLSDRNPLVRLGDCTYGLFLFHVPLMMAVLHAAARANWKGDPAVVWLAGTVAMIGGLLFGKVEYAVHGRLRPLAGLQWSNNAVRREWLSTSPLLGCRLLTSRLIGLFSQALLQVRRQVVAQVAIRAKTHEVDLHAAAAVLDRRHVLVQGLQITLADADRIGQEFRQLFEAAKQRHVAEREIDFGGIEHVEEHHLVLLIAQVLQAGEDVRHIVEQVGEDEDDAAAAGAAGEFMKVLAEVGGAGVGPVGEGPAGFAQLVHAAGAAQKGPHAAGERRQPQAVPLL